MKRRPAGFFLKEDVAGFGKRLLPSVLDCAAKQKNHHARETTKRRLKQMGFDDDGRPLPCV